MHTRRFWTRRAFAQTALTGLGLAALNGCASSTSSEGGARPNSKVAGVQVGLNVPYSFGDDHMSGEETLKNCLRLGVSAVELRTQPVEAFLGAPPADGKDTAVRTALAKWREGASLQRVPEFRAMYEKAGVLIEIVKVDGIFKMSDGELDYAFRLAKALGGRAISSEISTNESDLKRIGSFADKHRLMVGYHGHASTKPEHWEKAFALAKYNGANVDLGHFVAGNNTSPVRFIREHHRRITHVHVKDRKKNNGPNTVFGEGDTPIAEVLRLIRDNRWKIQATVEFEYKIPVGSDRMTEIARALNYCRGALKA